ncbi:unnamed protein product [Heligmosomoides polygyrus]|uniref:Uncharacterized protein n=1 Tax=Heligmosomoides polygyrus TaxID=6339 RepID=A0A183FYA4_HELPZ|nr:unnamed protein product [Heligmosomoides polygyrus]
MALQAKIPQAIADGIEEDRRMRSIVIAGIEEEPQDLPPSRCQGDLEDKMSGILDALQVELGLNPSHWLKAISNTRLLRLAGHTNIFVRKSMTREGRISSFGNKLEN